MPVRLKGYVAVETKLLAFSLERYFKSGSGRAVLGRLPELYSKLFYKKSKVLNIVIQRCTSDMVSFAKMFEHRQDPLMAKRFGRDFVAESLKVFPFGWSVDPYGAL